VKCDDILNYLNEYLDICNFSDYCVNGLQVEGDPVVTRITTGVSVSERLFKQANNSGSQLIIVHHGLFWKNTPHPLALTGILRDRVKLLLKNDITLAAYHLPLDAHPEIGNNAQIMKSLGIKTMTPTDIGFWGDYPTQITISEFAEKLSAILPDVPSHFNFGNKTIRRIAVISGGASTSIEMISKLGVDVFVSGDITEPVVRTAEELHIHFFSAGHYNTECFGPIELARHLNKKFSIPAEFIDVPNPI